LPVYNLGLHLLGLAISTNDDFIIYGETLISVSGTGIPYENKYKLFLTGYDRLFNKQFSIDWYEHLNTKSCYIQNLLFLDENNFIIVGNKDNVSFYIARLNKLNSNVENLGISNANFIISPNPATDFIEVQNPNYEKISIMNILGETIFTTSESTKIDVSSFPTGIYLVRIGDKVSKFLKL
jgi:hypothetical protein